MKPPRLPSSPQPNGSPQPNSSPQSHPEHDDVGVAPPQQDPTQPEPAQPVSRRRAVVEQLSGLRDTVAEVLNQEVPESQTHFRSKEAMTEAAAKARNKRRRSIVPARNLSGRVIALIIITVLMVLATIPSITRYVEQQQEITALEQDLNQLRQEQEHLESEIARWDDDAYVKQQARDRINLVMPGERKYLVIGDLPESETAPAESPHDVRADMPWADALLDSIRRAGTD